jgi:hypothetical protein
LGLRSGPVTSDDDEVRDALDYVAICRLHAAYADSVTRRAWSELRDQFLPDAPVRVDTVSNPAIDLIGPDAVGTFISNALQRFEFFEFTILNSHVALRSGGDPDAAQGRLYICELRQLAEDHAWSQAYGVYRDDYRRVDGRWHYARRQYQSLARTGGDVFAFPPAFEFD